MLVTFISILLSLLAFLGESTPTIRIPLTYAFDWDLKTKLPIKLSFNHSNIYSTSPTKELFLLEHNISANVKNFPSKENKSRVEIGLKFPSEFVVALSKTFGTPYESIQLGTSDYLQVLIFDHNIVQSLDIWKDGIAYDVHVKYNFGDDKMIKKKQMSLIQGETVYFQEYLIREVLLGMNKENGINFIFNEENRTINLIGKVENLPKITVVRGDYIFKLKLSSHTLNYIPALENKQSVTLVGYKAFKYFNKMRFLPTGEVVFKCTSLVYQLYLFLLYFVFLFLFLIFLTKKSINETGQFVKHILRWVLMKDMQSRVEVLKSELE